MTDPAKNDDSAFSKSWIFNKSTKSVTPLPSQTCSSPKTLIKKSLPTSGVFAQIVEIEVGKSKELFIERWNQAGFSILALKIEIFDRRFAFNFFLIKILPKNFDF